MALIYTRCIIKSPTGLIFRIFNEGYVSQKCLKYSTSNLLRRKDDIPIKYSTNRAAKVEIGEILGFKREEEDTPTKVTRIVTVVSLASLLIYFCILREENDVDQMLKDNMEKPIMMPERMKLHMDLKYCEKMNLPTDAIKARIEELEKNQKVKSPFIK